MASITKENLGNLREKIVVKVAKEDYLPSFEKAIKDYSKKVNIPGFRKGMVPAGMIKKMYGAPIFYDEVIKSIQKELNDYLEKEKPDIFGQPLPMDDQMQNINMNSPADYELPFEIGLKPAINLDSVASAKTVLYKVKVTPEMIDDQVEKLAAINGVLKEVEKITSPEDVLTFLFEESDAEGNIAEGGVQQEIAILLKAFLTDFQEQIKDKKKDDSVVVQLKSIFDDKEKELIFSKLGLDIKSTEANEKFFKMTIIKIQVNEKRELNEEYFNLIFPGKEIKTVEDFRKSLKEEMQIQWDAASRNLQYDQLYHFLIDLPLDLPEEFLKRWIEIGGKKIKTKEQVLNEFPTFASQLKWTLISDEIITQNNLEVTTEEVRGEMHKEITKYFGQISTDGEEPEWVASYIDRMMKDKKQIDSTYNRLITDKMFHWLATQVKPEVKEISAQEFEALPHHDHAH